MKKIKFKNIFVILFSALFLLTGNLAYSFSLICCETEECCEADCCEENESTEYPTNDLLLCEGENCCEYDQGIENDIKNPAVLSSNQNKYLPNTTQLIHYNLINCFDKFNLHELSHKQYPIHLSISILRI